MFFLGLLLILILVGHCHPRVTEAVTKQMQLQYTNTRYLNSRVINVSLSKESQWVACPVNQTVKRISVFGKIIDTFRRIIGHCSVLQFWFRGI